MTPESGEHGAGGVYGPTLFGVLPIDAQGPEDIAVLDGDLVTGVADGRLLRVSPAERTLETVAHTGGRPLGVETAPDGRIVVCDAERGLLRADPDGGEIEELVTTVAGKPLRLCDNAAVAADGTIYFSDSSRCYGLESYQADLLEHTGTGRLLRRDPDGEVEVLLDGLDFANGVALAPDESFVVVAETGSSRLLRVWLTGADAGEHDVFADDLPGLPDNVSTGSDGVLWVALPRPRSRVLNLVRRIPHGIRRMTARTVAAVEPSPPETAHVVGLNLEGHVVHDVLGRHCGYRMVTGVRERGNALFLGSLAEDAIAVVRSSLPPADSERNRSAPHANDPSEGSPAGRPEDAHPAARR
jgi:sugar lactone lactonase YvrE